MPERPQDLVYALDEKPPAPTLIAVGFQHVAVICPYQVMVALVVHAAKLPQEAARNAMALAMIAVAFLTVLQSIRLGRIGSGYLCPPVVSAIYLPSTMSAATTFGFPVVCGMVMFAGACEIVVVPVAAGLDAPVHELRDHGRGRRLGRPQRALPARHVALRGGSSR
jgi:NCS2 family nucleobase:cation symporter-2